jgi:ATP-dependent DNA helicase RecG
MVFKESNNLELKENYSRSYIKTVCAYANERDGRIIFGIDDEGEVIGLKNPRDVRARVEQAIPNNITPIPNFTLETQQIDKKEVVVLTVFLGTELPYSYDGKFYKRMDTQTVAADGITVRRWINESKSISFDALTTDENGFKFSVLAHEIELVTGVKTFTEDSLQVLGLKVGEKFTNAGMLLSDKNSFPFGCDAVKFGATQSEFLKRERVIGESVLLQYKKMMDFFDENYYGYEAVAGGKREKRIMIPREAFRETLANAIIHRDYRQSSNIQIECWENKVVITSPGGLPVGVTEEMYLNQSTSTLRNPQLAMIFLRLRLIESFGTGIWRIKEAYNFFAEQPKFEIFDRQIRVTLPKINYDRSGNEMRQYRIDKTLNLLEEGEKTRRELQAQLSINDTMMKELLGTLVHGNKIERLGKGRATLYRKVK